MNARSLRPAVVLLGGSAAVLLTVLAAQAQTLPWPTDPPGGARSAAAPVGMSPPPPPAMPSTAAPMTPVPQQAGPPPCFVEFARLRDETEKRGKLAKAGHDRKVPREEMCKLIQAYAATEAKWVKYTVDNAATCGIPQQAVQGLKGVHSRTLEVRKQICAAGPTAGGPPAPPSLSDALGTAKLPVPRSSSGASFGTLNTLTGNAIGR